MSELNEYTVVWTIDVEAEDEVGAARAAREIMQHANDPEYIANSFFVYPMVDLELDGELVDLDKIEGRIEED